MSMTKLSEQMFQDHLKPFPDRAAVLAALPGLAGFITRLSWFAGPLVVAKPMLLTVQRVTGAGAIPDMPGWEPLMDVTGEVTPEHFGAVGDGVTEDTAAFQAAIDWLNAGGSASQKGGVVRAGAKNYAVRDLVFRSLVSMKGAGMHSTVLVGVGSVSAVVRIPPNSIGNTLEDFAINGSSVEVGDFCGIHIENTEAFGGGELWPLDKSVADENFAFKHTYVNRVFVRACPRHGIWVEKKGFGVYFNNIYSFRNGQDGIVVDCTDSLFDNMYIGHNGRHGLHITGGANKFSNVKSIWNGRTTTNAAGIALMFAHNLMVNCEAQDNFCDGWWIQGARQQLVACQASANGHAGISQQGVSNGVSTHFRFFGSCVGSFFDLKGHSYTAQNPDLTWVTQTIYQLQNPSEFQPAFFNLADDGKFNEFTASGRFPVHSGRHGRIEVFTTGGMNETIFNISPRANETQRVRLFRDANPDVTSNFEVLRPGTATSRHVLRGSNGNASVCMDGQGDLEVGNSSAGGAWNGSRLRLGNFYFWVDASSRLRIKNGAPTSDTDGTIVGTQS
jgi:hypothetical protein